MRAFLWSTVLVAMLGVLVAGCSGDDDTSSNAGDSGDDGGKPPASRSRVEAPTASWVRSVEGVGDEGVTALDAHPDGSFVLLGTYEGPATFNPGEPDEMELAMPDGELESVLAHYAADGSLLSLQADPLGTGTGRAHFASDGSLYATGTGGFTAGTVMVPSDADVFVARYAPDGTPSWASSASGEAGMGAGSALATWDDGGVVIGGSYKGTITFGVGEASETRLASTSDEIFLARYDADGALLWAKRAIAAPYLPEWRLAAAPDGGIVLYGSLENTTTFNPGLGDETKLEGGHIGFLVKLDDAGTVQWSRTLDQAEGMNGISSVAAFADGSVVVTGSFVRILTIAPGERAETVLAAIGSDFPGRTQFPDFFAARFDDEGKLEWARREGGEVWDSGSTATALDDGATLITGAYTNTVTFADGEPAETTLSTASNDMTAFLAVIERDGAMRWIRQGVDGTVVPLADGSIAVAGTFMGTLTLFDGEPGETTLASAGGWDAYVALLSAPRR